MSWAVFKTELFSLINTNKIALGLQEVYSYPRLKFNGYPACSIFPAENPNEFETTNANQRFYVWTVRVFDETKEQGLEQALDNLYSVVDSVIDEIDKESMRNAGQTIGQSMPANYSFLGIYPAPGNWGESESENLVFVEITVSIKVSYDLT